MSIKKSLKVIGYTSWCGLGFIRGTNYYKYNQKKEFLYLDSVCYGFYGTLIYANPLLSPALVYKEIYRLEVNIRSIENEKNTDFYNDIF